MILAVEWYGDKMNIMKFLGLTLCMIGITGHMWKKYKSSRSSENRYGIIDVDDNKHLTIPESDSDDLSDSNSSTEVLFDILNRRHS